MQQKAEYFVLIDFLRGFAALSVLTYHVIEMTGWHDFPTSYGLNWFRLGWLGVDIFYVISGFVITLSALNIYCANNQNYWSTFKAFMKKRFRRIVPLHYLTILFFIILFFSIVHNSNFVSNLFAHLTFPHNFFPEFHREMNAPNWSLGVEFQFYIFIILIIPFITHNNIIQFTVCSFVLAFTWRAISFLLVDDGVILTQNDKFFMVNQLPGMMDFFSCGMLLAFFVKSSLFGKVKKSVLFKIIVVFLFVISLYGSLYVLLGVGGIYWSNVWAITFPCSTVAIWASLLVLLLCLFDVSVTIKNIYLRCYI